MERVKVALIGVGRIGSVHADGLIRCPEATLVAVVDVDSAAAQRVAEKANPPAAVFTALATAIKETVFDCAVVCSPTLTHAAVVQVCLESKKHVFCEKPLSLALNEIDALYNLAAANGVQLLTGYHRRHDPNFAAARRAVVDGEIGSLQVMKSTSRDNPIPAIPFLKTSGGIIHDCGSHDIDMIRWVMREDPIEVFASGSCFNEDIKAINDHDTIVIQLKFASGALAVVDLARQSVYGYDQRIEVLGTRGMVQVANQTDTTVVRASIQGVAIDPNCYSFPTRYRDAYRIELEHFIQCVRDNEQPLLTHEDVRKTAIICDAANKSLGSGELVKIAYN